MIGLSVSFLSARFPSDITNHKKIVGTQHPTIRYYDLNTSACFTSPTQRDHHRGPITDVTFNTDAKIFATSRNPVHHNVMLQNQLWNRREIPLPRKFKINYFHILILEPLFSFRLINLLIVELGKVRTGVSNYGMA